MFENKTFEGIMSSMLARVPDSFDKREGSVIYDALAPAASELIQAYISMDAVLDETFADTASITYLEKRVKERGLSRIPASYAVLKLAISPSTIILADGTRFSCDELNYEVIDEIDSDVGEYRIRCETAGSEGNFHFGQAIPVNYISGLETATITDLLIPARNAETADELRQRYFDSMTSQAYGGNIADYMQKTKAIDGFPVGACKVVPVWNGGGTVKVIILDELLDEPSQDLIDGVQNALDPVGHSGEGYGIAPIGHVVTVVGGQEETIDIDCTISYETGWNWDSAKDFIKASIDAYFISLKKQWEDSDALIVRISGIEMAILNSTGVVDVTGTELNGDTENITLNADEIPIRGEINGNA